MELGAGLRWYAAGLTESALMKEGPSSPQVVRFGVFEVDLRSGELRKQGFRIRLQEQPFRILTLLVERPGEVVSREELQQKLWPEGTFVDFEKGLNIAVRKLRDALGDSADSPRFVETLSRRGYRFIASVQTRDVEGAFVSAHDRATASMVPGESRAAESSSTQLSENQAAAVAPAPLRRLSSNKQQPRLPNWGKLFAAGLPLLLLGGFFFWWLLRRPAALGELVLTRLTSDSGLTTDAVISPDGKLIAYASDRGGSNLDIWVKQISGGDGASQCHP
jgi:DNA-binding winged helix-turn-helix (wHTH) protein